MSSSIVFIQEIPSEIEDDCLDLSQSGDVIPTQERMVRDSIIKSVHCKGLLDKGLLWFELLLGSLHARAFYAQCYSCLAVDVSPSPWYKLVLSLMTRYCSIQLRPSDCKSHIDLYIMYLVIYVTYTYDSIFAMVQSYDKIL